MKVLLLAIVFALAIPTSGIASEIMKVTFPEEVRQEVRQNLDPDLQGLQWNRWESENFVVCATNDKQAKFLHDHLEQVKTWSLNRWGLADVKFSAECILLCVDDAAIYKKFFNIEESKVEIRRENGKIKRNVIFLLGVGQPSDTVPIPVMEVCLSEYEQANNVKFGWWAHRGMSNLNGSLGTIRQGLADLSPLLAQNSQMYFSQSLLTATQEQYDQLGDNRRVFDLNATAMCLMLRKEFGQDRFHKFLGFSQNPEVGLREVYKFNSYSAFDMSYKRFMIDIAAGVAGTQPGRPITPDSYLQIREKMP
jgi:hypothetical protein